MKNEKKKAIFFLRKGGGGETRKMSSFFFSRFIPKDSNKFHFPCRILKSKDL